MEGNSIVLEKKSGNKTDKKRIHALHSHLNNAINGLEKKYEYRLQICSIHFPMNVKVEKDKFVVKNFFGERKERILTIKPNVSLKVENDIVTVTSPDKNLAGEQASEIEALTKVTSRDRRVFQDGIWIIKKSKGRKNGED
jgi:large subunit ribosomal protein L6